MARRRERHGSRRQRPVAIGAAIATAVGLVLAGTGAGQAPPDERAAARAFADASLRYEAAIAAIGSEFDDLPNREWACAERVRRRIPERRWDDVNLLTAVEDEHRPLARLVEPPLTAFSTELHAVATADPALRGGRTAVRRIRRVVAAVAALPRIDVCAELARWVQGGLRSTPALTRARRAVGRYDRVIESQDVRRRMCRTGLRLRELGVPERDTVLWDIDCPPERGRR